MERERKREREREIKLRETNWRRGKKVERWKGGKGRRREEGREREMVESGTVLDGAKEH